MNTEHMNEYLKDYRQKHKEELRQWRKRYYPKYYRENRDKILEWSREYYQRHRVQKGIYRKQHRQEIKIEVLTYYGNGKLACIKCGFNNVDALSIDHINGNGGNHRNVIGNSIYSWLRARNYPDGYQTLCMNCQYIKREEDRING